MIDDVTGASTRSPAGGRAGMAALEGSPNCRVPFDPAVCVALAGGAARRNGPGVAHCYAGPTGVVGRTVAGFGPGGAAVGARFATGNGATRGAGVLSLTGGWAGCDGGEEQGEEESAHTRVISAD